MANHLIEESSPYLLQHADNPVDWYPWGEEAFASAREKDLPILLSVGYAACHWCHVMAHESFEDIETAEIMNGNFVNIKVDREERPDVDNIYMSAVQALTGQGGWPMTVFMTPDGRPFYGGTYFPPVPRFNMPGFRQLLEGVVNAWQSKRDEIEESAGKITSHIVSLSGKKIGSTPVTQAIFERAMQQLGQSFDMERGGFGGAPKFPPAMSIEFLLRMHVESGDPTALQMAEKTLEKMAYGGMYDQLGGGFARYSTDASWLVPHFEKMLYDNALLSRAYLHAWQVTGKVLYRRIAEETLDFVAGEMRHRKGGFYSSYDADSEGEEGKFYVWQPAEVEENLEEDAGLFMLYYDVTDDGNWEGKSILNVRRDLAEIAELVGDGEDVLLEKLNAARKRLYAVRSERVWPGLDDKILTSWNGLMLASFAEAGRLLKRADFTNIAIQNARFLSNTMRLPSGRLLRTWTEGAPAKFNGYLEDYAYLADGLLALYQSTFDEEWFAWAVELAEVMVEHFADGTGGGFYDTSDDHERLISRPKDLQDNAIPSANAMAASVLLKLSLFTGDGHYWDLAVNALSSMTELMGAHPGSFSHWLSVASFALGEPLEVAIAGEAGDPDTEALLDAVHSGFRPNLVTAVGSNGETVPLLKNRTKVDKKATAFVCRRFVCQTPVTEVADLMLQLERSDTGP